MPLIHRHETEELEIVFDGCKHAILHFEVTFSFGARSATREPRWKVDTFIPAVVRNSGPYEQPEFLEKTISTESVK